MILVVFSAQVGWAAAPNPHNDLDCLYCHDDTPSFEEDTRETVGFYRVEGDDPSICFACHKPEENLHPIEVIPGPESAYPREPEFLPLGSYTVLKGRVVCTTCHDIHAENAEFSLLRGFKGSKPPDEFSTQPDLCRHCHGGKLERLYPHGDGRRSCALCHLLGFVGIPAEGDLPPTPEQKTDLCRFCHRGTPDTHYRGLNPFEEDVDCLVCHNPHLGPEQPGHLKPEYFDFLRGTITVDPHVKRLLCSLCHVEEKKFTLLIRDSTALCNRCHASPMVVGSSHYLKEIPEGITPPAGWPVRGGFLNCLTCHFAGHLQDRNREKLLRGGPYESRSNFCRNCHKDTTVGETNPHLPLKEGKLCEFCHVGTPDIEKEEPQKIVLVNSLNFICIRCHEDLPHPTETEHTIKVSPERAATIPEQFPLTRYNRLTCATCHNSHIEGPESSIFRKELDLKDICSPCHATH
jgi:hypothetical protein